MAAEAGAVRFEYIPDWGVRAYQGGKDVGRLILKGEGRPDPIGGVPVRKVWNVTLDYSLRGQGYGTQMYEFLADSLRRQFPEGVILAPAHLPPGPRASGPPKAAAARVWNSLAKRHPTLEISSPRDPSQNKMLYLGPEQGRPSQSLVEQAVKPYYGETQRPPTPQRPPPKPAMPRTVAGAKELHTRHGTTTLIPLEGGRVIRPSQFSIPLAYEKRRTGVGTQLFQDVLEETQKNFPDAKTFRVYAPGEGVVRFWEKQGFKVTDPNGPLDSRIMERPVTRTPNISAAARTAGTAGRGLSTAGRGLRTAGSALAGALMDLGPPIGGSPLGTAFLSATTPTVGEGSDVVDTTGYTGGFDIAPNPDFNLPRDIADQLAPPVTEYPEEEQLMAAAEDLDATKEEAFASMAPIGDFSKDALNSLVDALNKALPLFGAPEDYATFAEDIEGALPTEFVRYLAMTSQAANDANLGRLAVDLENIGTDSDLMKAAGQLDVLAENDSFRTFMASADKDTAPPVAEEVVEEEVQVQTPISDTEVEAMFVERAR